MNVHQIVKRKHTRIGSRNTFEMQVSPDAEPQLVTVRDWSVAGARLILSEAADLPETISITKLHADGERGASVSCKIIWQKGCEAGLVFSDPA